MTLVLRICCQCTAGSYAELAQAIERPQAVRAVALANAANPLLLLTPCHRIIRSNGHLGGFAAGVARKTWLLQHEHWLTSPTDS